MNITTEFQPTPLILTIAVSGALFVAASIGNLARLLFASWIVRKWVRVEANLVSLSLKMNEAGKIPHGILAKYRYTFGGKEYEGDRVVLVSNYYGRQQKKLYCSLHEKIMEKRPIDVWVDPNNPNKSVISNKVSYSIWLMIGIIGIAILVSSLYLLVSS